jgi:hypothetical protein
MNSELRCFTTGDGQDLAVLPKSPPAPSPPGTPIKWGMWI